MSTVTYESSPGNVTGLVSQSKTPASAALSDLVVVIRASKPFPVEPVGRTVEDMARFGARYVGCNDPNQRDGDPFILAESEPLIVTIVHAFARLGRAPWNTDPALRGQPPDVVESEILRRWGTRRSGR